MPGSHSKKEDRSMRRVYVLATVVAVVAILLVAVPASAAPASHAGGSGCAQFYTVRRGDTLSGIAAYFGTSTWALANLNGIPNPDQIYAGQTICVRSGQGGHPGGPPPGGHPGGPPPGGQPCGQSCGFTYTVRCGDTLYSISRHFGVSVGELASVNHICDPNRIYVGQVLVIPHR